MIPYVDLKKQYHQIQGKIDSQIQSVLEHGQYIMGPEITELEDKLANYVGTKHVIGCSSGTDALLLSLMALGVGLGDEVIIPEFSFFATAEVVSLLGASPVPVDVKKNTYNLNPDLLKSVINNKTKAIIPVSLYGQCADFDEINKMAEENGIAVIEDGAQSFGATYKGKRSCGLSTVGCTSFFPSKPLGGYGDSGAIFTNDDELALKMREFLKHGQSERYIHTRIGLNARMDTLQAAILLEKLAIFDEELAKRQMIASRYTKGLCSKFSIPYIEEWNISAWAQFTIQVDDREGFQKALKSNDIPTSIHYPLGISEQPVYEGKYSSQYPVTKKISRRVISLPFHPYLDEKVQDGIIKTILEV